jgi:peroxiredoxin
LPARRRLIFSSAQQTALKIGQPAPDFTLPSTINGSLKLNDLRGKPVILAFYPGDFTPVCTSQLALYNEVLDMFAEFDAQLLGISTDDLESHQAFSQAQKLSFPLLADYEPLGAVSRMYDSLSEKRAQSKRNLFVIDRLGILRWSYKSPLGINPGANGILNALESLG